MNTFLKVFLTQRLQFCVYFILDVHNLGTNFYYFSFCCVYITIRKISCNIS
ncbi:hypothetical protein [Spiroplasma endosymbiont of Aleiodes alternator]|uniref:hypothetical protein n=1 Tax=Spiroplasma endosymbiont of Aleiodes alternator TaxID=3139329 RepID=UPI003CCAE87F